MLKILVYKLEAIVEAEESKLFKLHRNINLPEFYVMFYGPKVNYLHVSQRHYHFKFLKYDLKEVLL